MTCIVECSIITQPLHACCIMHVKCNTKSQQTTVPAQLGPLKPFWQSHEHVSAIVMAQFWHSAAHAASAMNDTFFNCAME